MEEGDEEAQVSSHFVRRWSSYEGQVLDVCQLEECVE